MTVDQLRYFFEAARFQHIGKAAKSIHISPSAISAAIATLEAELELSLFDRQGKNISLNLNGRALQAEAEKILDSLQGLKMRMKGEDSDLKGQFRLGASHFLASGILTKTASLLQASHPHLVIEICSLSTSLVISEVVSGTLDLGVCFSPINHPDLLVEDIYRGQLQIAVRKNHPLTKLTGQKSLKALSDFPAVIHKSNPGVDICENHPIFEEFAIKVQTAFLFDSDESAVNKLIHSDTWALLPDVVIQKHDKHLSLVSLPSRWNAPYRISSIVRRDRSRNEVLKKCLKLLNAELSEKK